MAFAATNCNKISGAYRMYFTPNDGALSTTIVEPVDYLGITGPEGVRLTREDHVEMIYDDENGPEAPQDAVFRGSSAFIEFVLQDIDRQVVYQMLYPWTVSGTPPVDHADHSLYGTPGQFACSKYGKLEMIPITGTSAAGAAHPNAASGAQGRQMMGILSGPTVETMDTSPRFIPVRFQMFPFTDDGLDTGTVVLWNWITNYTGA